MHDSGDLRRNRPRAHPTRPPLAVCPTRRRTAVRLATALAAVAVLGTASIVAAGPAGAAPSSAVAPAQQCNTNTSVTPSLTTDVTTIDSTATSTIKVTGTNYLVPPHVCGSQVVGGIYVFFGWVQPGGQWGPSHRTETSAQGLFGTSYSYPGEGGGAETRDDGTGAVRLISFTEGGDSGDATTFHMDDNGNWATDLVVRGSTYSFTNVMDGSSRTVDCLKVQCGVFTIGAHGKASGTNELFTPINFTVAGTPVVPQAAAGAGGASSPAAQGGGTAGGTVDGGSGATGPGGAAGDGVTTTTAAPGEVGTVGAAGGAASDTGDEQADGATVDAETTAAVQDFDRQGGSGGGVVIAVVVVLVPALAAGGVVLLRRRSAAAVGAGR